MGARRASRRVSSIALQILTLTICISLRNAEKLRDEDKVGQQAKTGTTKAKVAAATVPPTREDELTKQLKYQQHQIDTLVGQVRKLVSAVKSARVSSKGGHGSWLWKATPKLMERRF